VKKMRVRTIAAVLTGALLAGVLWVPVSFSQSNAITAEIPFAFYVDKKVMPAGTYRVQAASSGSWVMRISDDKGNAAFVATTLTTNREPSTGRMVFNRYGSTYFLSELHWPENSTGHALRQTEHERELIASHPRIPVELTAK